MPILEPIAYDIRRSGWYGAGMDSAGSGLELRENPRAPSPGAEVGGEVDEALSMFWYRNLLLAGTDSPEIEPDWGIHVIADVLVVGCG